MGKRIIATIEARMTSSRLPGKVMLPLAGIPSIGRMVERVKRSELIDDVYVATTTNSTDDELVQYLEENQIKYFRGSEDDVLLRVLDTARSAKADIIVELTGDCPLADHRLIDKMIHYYFESGLDYVNNRLEKGLPDGLDVQVFSVAKLAEIEKLTHDPIDRVHVSCYFYNNPDQFKVGGFTLNEDDELYWPDLAITLDEKDDYQLINDIFEELLPKNNDFSAYDIIKFLKDNPKLVEINQNVRRKSLEEG